MARVNKASTARAKSGAKIKQVVAALEESQERLRKMFESVTDGISVVDLNGLIAEVNQRMVEMHGFASRDELLGRSAFELVAPRDHERIAANMRRAIKRGTIRGVEYTLLKADGSEFPGELSTSILKDASGNWIGHITIARDITEHKRAQDALQESEERYRAVIEGAHDMIQSVALDGRIIFVNRAWLDTLGYTSAELPGLNLFQIIHPDSLSHCRELFAKVINGEAVHGIEASFLTKDGRRILVEGNAAPRYVGDEIVATQGIFRGITERRQAEEALADEVTRRRLLVDQSRDGIVVLDENAKVYEANQRFAEMLGYTPEEVHELHTWDWDKNFPPEKLLEMGRKVDEKGLHLETQHHRKDGSVIDVDISINGAVCGGQKLIFCVCRDVTERKRAEEALAAAQERLIRSEKLAAIGQLASGVGHELRNPLGAIKNAVLYVRRKIAGSELSASEPRVMEFLGLADEEVDSANKVITDLLSFSRVAKPAVSLVNASSIISDALNHVAVPGNVELITDVDPGVPMVMVDAGQIQQVFVNVILNALEAMPEGGRLEIRARGKDEVVTVEFTDTGGGISEPVMGKIFDPLFTTKAKGIGLGLAMSKSIMERHGGDIGVRSKEGKGTTFTLSLPTRVV